MIQTAHPDRDGAYAIREPQGVEEFSELARVFGETFQLPQHATPPAWLMEDIAKAGGLTLGLWHGEQAVGFSFAFPGVEDGTPYLFSDGLGVLPAHRAHGQGHDMKLAQREHALRLGYARIRWTFSALRSVNAHLYLTRLGALSTTYLPNKRGALDAEWGTEGGVPFDEFLVDWWIDSERVRARLAGDSAPPPLDSVPVVTRCDGEAPDLVLRQVDELPSAERIAVEVAPDYQALVDHSPQLARDWHEQTSPLFTQLLERGYAFTECVRQPPSGRVLYLFERTAR